MPRGAPAGIVYRPYVGWPPTLRSRRLTSLGLPVQVAALAADGTSANSTRDTARDSRRMAAIVWIGEGRGAALTRVSETRFRRACSYGPKEGRSAWASGERR